MARQAHIDRRHREKLAQRAEYARVRELEAQARLQALALRQRISDESAPLREQLAALAAGAPIDAQWVRARRGDLAALALSAGNLSTCAAVLAQLAREVAGQPADEDLDPAATRAIVEEAAASMGCDLFERERR